MIRVVCVIALIVTARPEHVRAQDRFFEPGGIRIRYIEQGQGQPVILVHGANGSIESNWVETGVLPNLSRDHRVIAFDQRGHGRSCKPHGVTSYGREMAEDIVRLLNHLNIPKAHIVGYSLGGIVAASAVVRHADRVQTFTLGGSTPNMREWTKERLAAIEARALETEQGILRTMLLANAPPNEPRPTDEAIRQRSATILAGQDRQALADIGRSYPALTVAREQLSSLRVPVQAVVGSDDPRLLAVKALSALMPGLSITVIAGATHNAPRNARARPEFVEAIRTFVAQHRAVH